VAPLLYEQHRGNCQAAVNMLQIMLSHLTWNGKGLPSSVRVRFRWWRDEGPGDSVTLAAAQQGQQNRNGAKFLSSSGDRAALCQVTRWTLFSKSDCDRSTLKCCSRGCDMAAGASTRTCATIGFPLHAPPQQVHAYLRAMGCLTLLVEAAASGCGGVDSGRNGAGCRGVHNRSTLGWASVNLERLSTAGCMSGGHVVCMRHKNLRFSMCRACCRTQVLTASACLSLCLCPPS
jgi:hypothetical protein